MANTELVNDKNKCCGCGLCSVKCPKHAIEMKEDEYGFIYPYIDKDKCVNCGICKKVCSYNKKIAVIKGKQDTYAAVSKDKEILNSTASGGIFTSIAISIINDGGMVFGSSLSYENNKFNINHIKVCNIADLEKLKGSKYVQSNIFDVYKVIKQELSNNKKVLFSGTPCQVAAIKEFTNNDVNLYTIDIICHGVPSNKLFNDYIEYINKKNNIEIKDFKFRVKDKGWGLYYYYYYLDKKTNRKQKKVKPAFESSYYQLFLDSYTYRDNCYSCPYANDKRIGDITIGDFWGIEIEHPELISSNKINPELGVSCIIVNTEKGRKLLDSNNNYLKLKESNIDRVKKHNHQLNYPSKKQEDRKLILDAYKENGYKTIEQYYRSKGRLKKTIKKIWYKLPYRFRKIIKK